MSIKIQINKSTNNINKLRIYLRAVPKWGKTTLFRNIVLEKYNGEATKGLLIGIKDEIGYTLLDELQTTHCNTWKELKELENWLIKEKGKEHNIEFIAFDCVDELLPIAEKEVMRLSQIQTGKPCDSINKAMGGYGKGQEKVKEILKEYFTTLYKAGFGIFCIAHTKMKTIVEKGKNEDEGYSILTSNLANTYESIFADIFDCVLTGLIDRSVNDGKLEDTERRLYFRGTTAVEAGTRFSSNSVPEYLVVDDDPKEFAKNFLETIEDGMRNSATKPLNKEQVKKEVEKEKKQAEKDLKQVQQEVEQQEKVEEEQDIDELKAKLKSLMTTTESKNKVKDFMKGNGVKSVKDLSTEQLEELIGLLS